MINSSKERCSQLHLVLDERAETALRYLNDKERQRVLAKLEILEIHSPESVKAKYPKLASQPGSAPHYFLRLTPKLRAIFRSLGDNTVVVEDVQARHMSHGSQVIRNAIVTYFRS
jgi:hypothetical protein